MSFVSLARQTFAAQNAVKLVASDDRGKLLPRSR